MRLQIALRTLCAASVIIGFTSIAMPAHADGMNVVSDKTASGFKGPADFAVAPNGVRMLVVVPISSEASCP